VPKSSSKRKARREPAPAITHTEELRPIEETFRNANYVAKKVEQEGGSDDAIVRAWRQQFKGYDGSKASLRADVAIQNIDWQIDRDTSTQQGRSAGGKSAAKERKDAAAAGYINIRAKATSLLEAGRQPHEISGIISKQTGFSRTKVLRALRQHISGHWKKK
jgi:hypothetical protein